MVKIKIYQTNADPIEIYDNENSLEELTSLIKQIFLAEVVTVLRTSNHRVLIRPSRVISCLLIDEMEDKEVEVKDTKEDISPPDEDVLVDG